MVKENMSKVQKLTVSAMVMALYVVVLYFTQSFSFGAYQIRIATALYALAYLFPFLVLPLGFANFIANFLVRRTRSAGLVRRLLRRYHRYRDHRAHPPQGLGAAG